MFKPALKAGQYTASVLTGFWPMHMYLENKLAQRKELNQSAKAFEYVKSYIQQFRSFNASTEFAAAMGRATPLNKAVDPDVVKQIRRIQSGFGINDVQQDNLRKVLNEMAQKMQNAGEEKLKKLFGIDDLVRRTKFGKGLVGAQVQTAFTVATAFSFYKTLGRLSGAQERQNYERQTAGQIVDETFF